jgi:hypothetical protein
VLARSSLVCEVIMPSAADLYEFLHATAASPKGVTGFSAQVELVAGIRSYLVCPWVD